MGETAFVIRALPIFIGVSALGNVFAQTFAMPRVKQELAKEGILPFSRFWASDWPFNAPSGAILLHWILTTALILGSQVGPQGANASVSTQISTVYAFVTNVFIYTGNWIKSGYPVSACYSGFVSLILRFSHLSLPRRRPCIPKLHPIGGLGSAADHVSQLAAPHNILDRFVVVRGGGALYP